MRISILLILLFTGLCFAKPYEFDQSGAGINISYGYLVNSASFKGLPGIPGCCPRFETGGGNNIQLNLFYDYKLIPDLYLGLSLGFQVVKPNFSATEPTFVMDLLTDKIISGKFTHTVNITLKNIIFQPFISWNIFDKFRLGIAPYAAWLISKSYYQNEVITEPKYSAYFVDSNGVNIGRERNKSNGKLQANDKFYFGAEAYISFELPLNKENTLRLNPSFNYGVNIGSVLNGFSWDMKNFRLALGIRYDLTSAYNPAKDTIFHDNIIVPDSVTQPLITELPEDTTDYGSVNKDTVSNLLFNRNVFEYDTAKIMDIKVVTDTLIKIDTIDLRTNNDINLSYSILDFNGNRLSDGSEISLIKSEIKYPMLYTIYFDLFNTNIPGKYLNPKNSGYNFTYFNSYYEILENTGKYLKKNKDAEIGLTGYVSYDTSVSRKNANAIKDYLINHYKVNKNKIVIELNDIMDKSLIIPFMVDISSNDSGYYNSFGKPENSLCFEYPEIEFNIDKAGNIKIDKWLLTMMYNKDTVYTDSSYYGNKLSTSFHTSILAIPVKNNPGYLSYEFILWDSTGKIYKEDGKMRYRIKTGDGRLLGREFVSIDGIRNTVKLIGNTGVISVIATICRDYNSIINPDFENEVREYLMKYFPGADIKIYHRKPILNYFKIREQNYFENLIELRYYK